MRSDIDVRLSQLRQAIEEARQMPMSSSAMVNRTELIALVDRLDAAVSAALTDASAVVGERAAVVAAGHEEAAEIVRLARAEQQKLTSDTDVYRLAQHKADEILAQARDESAALRREAEEYVEAHLSNFELTLTRTLDTVHRGLSRLREGHAAGLSDDE